MQITSGTKFKGQGENNNNKSGRTERQMLVFTSRLRSLN